MAESIKGFKTKSGIVKYDYESLENLPDTSNVLTPDTVITVKKDGTGDFETITEAVDFLKGKSCTGTVTVSIGAGTFEESKITFNENHRNIFEIVVEGELDSNKNKLTTIYATTSEEASGGIEFSHLTKAVAKDLILKRNKTAVSKGITFADTNGRIANVEIQDTANTAIFAGTSSKMLITTPTIKNCATAIQATSGASITTDYSTLITASNVEMLIKVTLGGMITLNSAKKSTTSVTKEVSQTVGSVSANGMILGQWV